jgi:hypothetical protein
VLFGAALRYPTHILGSEHPFPPDTGPHEPGSLDAELAAVRSSVEAVGATMDACRSALLELQLQMTQLERQLARLEALSSVRAAGPDEMVGGEPVLQLPDLPLDAAIDRVERLRMGCEAILRRQLRASERPIVLRWAQLERGRQPVPVEEILDLAGRLLTRRTPEGTLPSSLAWCDATVVTLARGAAGPVAPRGMDAAAEFADLYERLADKLDAKGERR